MRVGAKNLSLSAGERAVASVGGVAQLAAASVSVGVSTSVEARRAQSASRSLRRALLMPQVNAGSLYRCAKRD